MEKQKISLENILNNPAETIEVPDYGSVQVKSPTTRDKLDAKREALKLTEGLDEDDKILEQARVLAIKMIVEPKITLEDYLNSNDSTISVILDNVHMWYNLKVKELNSKRQEQIKSFLKVMKEP